MFSFGSVFATAIITPFYIVIEIPLTCSEFSSVYFRLFCCVEELNSQIPLATTKNVGWAEIFSDNTFFIECLKFMFDGRQMRRMSIAKLIFGG
jgi:hypothetical protein